VLDDQQVRARAMVGEFDHPTEGTFPALRTPLLFDGFDDPRPTAPPLLGADNDDVLGQRLGLTDVELAALREEGVI
jgi:crotonobetainyl-CoA:carnitine CoA-transferase CaiB-like acyl-CoA transferase